MSIVKPVTQQKAYDNKEYLATSLSMVHWQAINIANSQQSDVAHY